MLPSKVAITLSLSLFLFLSLPLSLSLYLYMHTSWKKTGALKASSCNSANTPQPFPVTVASPQIQSFAPHQSVHKCTPNWREEIHASLLMACTNVCKPGVQKFMPASRQRIEMRTKKLSTPKKRCAKMHCGWRAEMHAK